MIPLWCAEHHRIEDRSLGQPLDQPLFERACPGAQSLGVLRLIELDQMFYTWPFAQLHVTNLVVQHRHPSEWTLDADYRDYLTPKDKSVEVVKRLYASRHFHAQGVWLGDLVSSLLTAVVRVAEATVFDLVETPA